MKKIKYFLLFAILLLVDQASKYWAKAMFMDKDCILIPKVLRFVYHENDGAAWGMFSGNTVFLILLTVVMVIAILYFCSKIPDDKHYTPLRIVGTMIIAGGIGNNLCDRLIHGSVMDFIYFELIDFPVFNVADMYIVVGTIILAFLILFVYKDEELNFLKKEK